jgi:transketolase
MTDDEHQMVDTLRFLAVDMVEEAKSGHPGLPLDAAPMAFVLWERFLRHNPSDPHWWDRDRFVLSAGHGSALLYALLHVYGYDLPMEELRRFRQYGSRTPGHPEYGRTAGVEASTGPLGQGFAMGVGMAVAERYLESRYNRPGFPIVDHWTYVLCSDGDLMEGISAEAASFAGAMRVGKLVYLYDDNNISLEGPTSLSFTEEVSARFTAYGWRVLSVPDGNDLGAIDAALREARSHPEGPTLIRVHTHIGYGSPKHDTREAHGEPLGAAATRATKEALGWPPDRTFYVPDPARARFDTAKERGAALETRWNDLLTEYRVAHPALAREFDSLRKGELPVGWDSALPTFATVPGGIATRDAGSRAMNAIATHLPALIGGSADLAPSTKTVLDGFGDWSSTGACGPNLHFGVRENAMVAIVNGMALHGGVIPFGATFFVFSDYAKPAIRISALQGTHSVLVFTHDSIGVGEDGPTHQPVEQLVALRAIPGLTVLRPADANETVEAWRIAVGGKGPFALVLTRQKLPVLDPARVPVKGGVARGAYTLAATPGKAPDVVLIGTGSEVQLCLAAQSRLEAQGVSVRVVSMPSWELFDASPEAYRDTVLPHGVPRVAVEAASPIGWERYAGASGAIVGLARFGASAPGPELFERLGFTPEHVAEVALAAIRTARGSSHP